MKAPRTVEQATELLAKYAELDGKRAQIEVNRNEQLASINAAADATLLPVIDELEQIEAVLSPWWSKAGAKLLPRDRKSMELGGCIVGTKKAPTSLGIEGKEEAIVAVLKKRPWAEALLRVTTKIDKKAALAALSGKNKAALAKLGLSSQGGEETFFINPVEQGSTVGSAS